MAAGEAVPPAAMMTHAMVDYPNVSSSPIAASEPRPFLQIMAATDRGSHPSGSKLLSKGWRIKQLFPRFADQKNFGSKPCPIGCFRSRGC